MYKIFDDVKSALIDGLEGLITCKSTPYAADLHNDLFNVGDHYIYYTSAKDATAELGVWQCIGVVQTYEIDHFN